MTRVHVTDETPHADWCRGTWSPDDCQLDIGEKDALIASGNQGQRQFIELALTRSIDPEYRSESMAPGETCVIAIAITDGVYEPSEYTAFTPQQARALARQLTQLVERADADAEALLAAGFPSGLPR